MKIVALPAASITRADRDRNKRPQYLLVNQSPDIQVQAKNLHHPLQNLRHHQVQGLPQCPFNLKAVTLPNGQDHSSIWEKEKIETHWESIHGSTQSADTYQAMESKITIFKPYCIMEHTAETRPSRNSPYMKTDKEQRQSLASRPNSKDTSYLLHLLTQSINNGSQLNKLTITNQHK